LGCEQVDIVVVQQAHGTEQILLFRGQEELMCDKSGDRGGAPTVDRELHGGLRDACGFEMRVVQQIRIPSQILSAMIGPSGQIPKAPVTERIAFRIKDEAVMRPGRHVTLRTVLREQHPARRNCASATLAAFVGPVERPRA
jgi:hypothetical protein